MSTLFSPIKNLATFGELDRYFEIQRVENEAASFIQRRWRKGRILLPWRWAVRAMRKVILIQKRVRGMLTRKRVAQWFMIRNTIVVGWQAHSRRFVANIHTKIQLAVEQTMTVKIQRIVRGKLARLRCVVILRDMAATRIQIMWRGVVARAQCDKIWLFKKTVIPIQNAYRRTLAIKKFKVLKVECNTAALVIQKKFRNWISCRKLGDALFVREMSYRMDTIRMLTAEEELCQEKLSKLMDRLIKNNSKHKAEVAQKTLLKVEEDVYRKENDLIEIKRQMDIISPRALEAGFLEELEKNSAEVREDLTQTKMKYLFETSAEVFRCDDFLEEQVREIEEWANQRRRVSECRQAEYEERLHLNYQRETNQRRRARRIAIADEKRRWQVLYFTRDGKPDKHRRPGKPWSTKVFAGPEKAVYSGGVGVDLLANTRKTKKTGSVQSADNTINQITLQTYLEQVQLYEHLLDPITSIMQNTMGGCGPVGKAGAGSSLAQRGWGPEGEKIGPALDAIGALPTDWAEQQLMNDVNDLSRLNTANTTMSNTSINSSTMNTSRSAASNAYNSDNSGNNTARSAASYSSTGTANSRRSILKKKSAYGTAGSTLGNTRRNKAQSTILVPRLETIPDDVSVDGSQSEMRLSTSLFEEFSSVSDMFRNSTRVRRKNKNRVSYMPSKESFSSSFRSNIRNISSSNLAQHQNELQSHGFNDGYEINSLDSAENSPHDSRRNSSNMLGSTSYGGVMSSSSSPQRQRQQQSGISHSKSMSLVPHLSHLSEVVPLVQTSNSSVSASNSVQSSYNNTREPRKKKVRERNVSTIPWELLDQLDGEKQRFNNERSYIDFHSKL